MTDYQRIEKAILYLKENFKSQPDLDEVAKQVYLSPFHFQRLFKDWAGVTPKKFLQFTSLEYAKKLLTQQLSVSQTSFETGFSGTSRLHDLFVGIEGMTPGEYKNGGETLSIQYSYAETLFGDVLLGSTTKGVCHLAFVQNEKDGLENLRHLFPRQSLHKRQIFFNKMPYRFLPKIGLI